MERRVSPVFFVFPVTLGTLGILAQFRHFTLTFSVPFRILHAQFLALVGVSLFDPETAL